MDLVSAAPTCSESGGGPWASGSVSWRAAPRGLKEAARLTAALMEEAGVANTRAAPSPLGAIQSTSDELTVLYSNGPDDRSVKLALGYVTAATCGC